MNIRKAKFDRDELEAAIAGATVVIRCEYGASGRSKGRTRSANAPHRADFWGKHVTGACSRKVFLKGPA